MPSGSVHVPARVPGYLGTSGNLLFYLPPGRILLVLRRFRTE